MYVGFDSFIDRGNYSTIKPMALESIKLLCNTTVPLGLKILRIQ